jgi:hypothetical protein
VPMKTTEVRTVVFRVVTVGFASTLFALGLVSLVSWQTAYDLQEARGQLHTCRDDVYRLSPAKPHFVTVTHKADGRVALFFDGEPAVEYDPSKLGDGKSYWWTGSVTVAVGSENYLGQFYPAVQLTEGDIPVRMWNTRIPYKRR